MKTKRQRGFTLIEVLVVMLIVGILSATATGAYIGYVRLARTSEAVGVAHVLWSAISGQAQGLCGVNLKVSDSFGLANIDPGGTTKDGRWEVTGGGQTAKYSCTESEFDLPSILFTVRGVADDVNYIRVRMRTQTRGTPPQFFECSTDNGESFQRCS